jgi:type IV pilus biogenesis protein CpaD/CtpE
MWSEIHPGVCGSDEPKLTVPEREARASGYSEAMADQLSGFLDRIDDQVKEARAIAATAAEGDPTALDELTGPIEEMAVAIAALRAATGVSRVAADG